MIKKKYLILVLLVFILLLTACGKMSHIPFSNAKWSWSETNVLESEGKPKETYNSIYGGKTFVFDKEFMGHEGSVKYMFDENCILASIAWAYSSNNQEDVSRLYSQIENKETKMHGKSEFSNTNDTANGDVWYLDDYDVLITTLTTDKGSALQYAYINKDFSKEP